MRIGIYGGTFNPVHNGHVRFGLFALNELQLDKLLVIPTLSPPHKSSAEVVSGEHRLNMLKLAFNGAEKVTVSDMELKRGGASYTVDTLTEIKRIYPAEAELFLIVGSDMFMSLHRWKDYRRICELATVCTAPRKDEDIPLIEQYRSEHSDLKSKVLNLSVLETSSTDARRGDVHELPDIVREYIRQNSLYGYDKKVVEYDIDTLTAVIRKLLGDKRYKHSLNVADMAEILAIHHGENSHYAYVAGLVHDITKEFPEKEQLRLLAKSECKDDPLLHAIPPIWHGFTAEIYLMYELNLLNTAILKAVRYHSVGHSNMTTLEKIVYLADIVSADRKYNGVEKLRELCFDNLDAALLKVLARSLSDNLKDKLPIYSSTLTAYNSLVLEKSCGGNNDIEG